MMARKQESAGHTVRVIRPKRCALRETAPREVRKWLAYVDKFLLFGKVLRTEAKEVDVVHICDQAYALCTMWVRGVPVVVTCHDLLSVRSAVGEFPGRTRWTGQLYQRLILRGLERAAFIGCDSEATRCDLLRLTKIAPERAVKIYVGLSFGYAPVARVERLARLSRLGIERDGGFLLQVGANVWYKNIAGVINIFSRLVRWPGFDRWRLIMVGSEPTAHTMKLIRDCGLGDRVVVLSDVPSEALAALYSEAEALLFPSICEGFGWPIIEAQACGCPVFTSNRPPMTEIGGRAAAYLDPEDYDGAALIIRENLPNLKAMQKAGLLNAQRFSAGRMSAGYARLYTDAVGAAERGGPGHVSSAARMGSCVRDQL
jgi:glycosyltransferase involved in cell wall biosynthesis